MADLTKLFEPISIGGVTLRNRLVMLAMGTHVGNGPEVNERVKAYYQARARGGVGLIEVGTLPISDVREKMPNQISIFDDHLIGGLRQLTRAIHQEGASAFAQLGIFRHWRRSPGSPLMEEVGPSDVNVRGKVPRPLTIDDIHVMTAQAGEATRRAREAEFDGIEILGAIGQLVSRFLSPLTNTRTDQYGGSLENRARFLLEIIEAIKERAGVDFPITCKISGSDFMEGGNTIKEAKGIAQLLERAGIKALNVAAGWHDSPVPFAVAMVPQGAFAYLSQAIREVVNVPVMATYRISDPAVAARILADGEADLIGMGRAFLADPEWANKVKEGRLEDIRPCIACMRCFEEGHDGLPLSCSVNPTLAREHEGPPAPAARPKKIFVAGGGPCGLEAAVTAATRGHEVTLFEKNGRLGGQLLAGAAPPYKTEVEKLNRYLVGQVVKANVKLSLNQELTPRLVEEAQPDAVIVATGAVPVIPAIPGVNCQNVVTAIDVLIGARTVGEKVVIIGGGMVGCETAELLASRGTLVTIVEMLGKIATDAGPSNRYVIRQRVKTTGITLVVGAKAEKITPQGVIAMVGSESKLIEADTVVLAVGLDARKPLADALDGRVPVYLAGDCVAPRRIKEAITEGYAVGARI